MAGPDIQAVRNFFQIDNGIIFPRGGLDFGVALGNNIYVDADQAVPNDYITSTGTNIRFHAGGVLAFSIGATNNLSINHIIPGTDNNRNLGATGTRWQNGLFGTQVGIHSGAGFTDFLAANALGLQSQPALTVQGAAFEELLLGTGIGLHKIPRLPTVSTTALILNPTNGMMVINQATGFAEIHEGGAWRVF